MGIEPRRIDLLYPELSYQIVGVLFETHRELGNRHPEKYYQRAVAVGLAKRSIPFIREAPVELKLGGVLIGKYAIDFMIADKILLELKTVQRFTNSDFRQVDGYLRAMNKELAILANFRTKDLTYKRILNPLLK